MINALVNISLTLYFEGSMLLTAPISFLCVMTIFPGLIVFLLLIGVCLKIFMENMGGKELGRTMSERYGKGSVSYLLSKETADTVLATLPILGKPAEPLSAASSRHRTFDMAIAETAAALSALIYERNSDKIQEAFEVCKKALEANEVIDPTDDIVTPTEKKMKQLLWESEVGVRSVAEKWGLSFTGISELKSVGGPFCGMFWSDTEPFIVIAFKGTTVTNYREFLVDATLQRTDARPFIFGSTHQGFYESVFPTSGSEDQGDPYSAILAAIHSKAKTLQQNLQITTPIQVWITGHSLGAAMSSLLFARFLKCPEDLPATLCTLRDCYVIGAPAVGDSEFASNFASFSNNPVSRSSTLWRIINQTDIVCRLPPGYNSRTIGHFSSKSDFFNYCHVGIGIKLESEDSKTPVSIHPSSYQPAMQVTIDTKNCLPLPGLPRECQSVNTTEPVLDPFDGLPPWMMTILEYPYIKKMLISWLAKYDHNPLRAVESLYPVFLKDHIPYHYHEGLERAKAYYTTKV
ncbi:Alpha/Beta hydrolase protein [Phycomyces blakesleeanus]